MSKQLNRPDYVEIGSLEWNIHWDEKMKNGLFGLCDAASLTIKISSSIGDEAVRRSTLLHEIMHAACFTYWFNVPEGDRSEKEESIVGFMSSAIFDILTSNKHVASYLFNESA